MTIEQKILSRLPYAAPFLFVDELSEISEAGVKGSFTLKPELDFYKGHFKQQPVTPGVILTEIMAQIGLACLGIYLTLETQREYGFPFALSSTEVHFYKPVYPGATVTVSGTKEYFRFGKLKSKVVMTNELGETVCEGWIAGVQLKENETT